MSKKVLLSCATQPRSCAKVMLTRPWFSGLRWLSVGTGHKALSAQRHVRGPSSVRLALAASSQVWAILPALPSGLSARRLAAVQRQKGQFSFHETSQSELMGKSIFTLYQVAVPSATSAALGRGATLLTFATSDAYTSA